MYAAIATLTYKIKAASNKPVQQVINPQPSITFENAIQLLNMHRETQVRYMAGAPIAGAVFVYLSQQEGQRDRVETDCATPLHHNPY